MAGCGCCACGGCGNRDVTEISSISITLLCEATLPALGCGIGHDPNCNESCTGTRTYIRIPESEGFDGVSPQCHIFIDSGCNLSIVCSPSGDPMDENVPPTIGCNDESTCPGRGVSGNADTEPSFTVDNMALTVTFAMRGQTAGCLLGFCNFFASGSPPFVLPFTVCDCSSLLGTYSVAHTCASAGWTSSITMTIDISP